MRKRLGRSIAVVAAAALSGLFVTPAQASTPTICTPYVPPFSVIVADQEIVIVEERQPVCQDVPDPEELPNVQVTTDENGATHIEVHRAVITRSVCLLGTNGACHVYLDLYRF